MDGELYILYDEDILASRDLSSLIPVSVQDNKIMEKELKVSDIDCLPSPEIPKRYNSVSSVSGCKTIHFNKQKQIMGHLVV